MLGWGGRVPGSVGPERGLFHTMLPSSGGRGNWLPFRQLNQKLGSYREALVKLSFYTLVLWTKIPELTERKKNRQRVHSRVSVFSAF